MFGKFKSWLGIATSFAATAESQFPSGGEVVHSRTQEEAKTHRIATKKRKAAKAARRRNRGRR